jgi:type II secretory pathway pseudopilin PulG
MRKEMMNTKSRKTCLRRAVTLLELIVAMAMITIIFAAILPQFALIRNSWDSKQGIAEAIQNGRVLIDHINRNLSKAVRITAVSVLSDSDGYIEFEDNDGNTMRYDISDSSYVEYGVVGNLSDLAGPVSSLEFSCYDACDLDNPLSTIVDVNSIRVVKIDVSFTNSASLGQDRSFTTWIYLRTNGDSQECWQHEDIGSVAAAGSASSTACNWTISGSGVDIWDNTDEFHFVYQSLSGDGQIIARVVSMTNTNTWAKAGVMIRETLTGGSKHAMMVVTPGNGTAFQRRTSTGGASTHTAGSSVVAPYWVKIKRVGNTLTGYESPNGSTWTQVGTDTVSMASNIYIGLCVTSHNDGVLCSAAFDNVSYYVVTYETYTKNKDPSDAASLVISRPVVNIGDLLIAAVATDEDTSTSIAAPGGWTFINRGSDSSGQVTLGAWYKIVGASEPASYTFTWTGAQQAYGWIMSFTGHDSSNPINTSSAASSSGSATPSSPAVTTTVDNCMILRLGAFDDDDIVIDNPGLAGHTAITMDESAAGSAGTVSYRGFGEGKRTSGGTSVVVTAPGSISSGDLLIAAVSTDGSTAGSISSPAGWTLLDRGIDSAGAITLGVWYRIAGASEPANYTFTWTGNQQAYGWISRFTGHNSSTPVNALAAQGGSSTSASPPCPSVTTMVANSMIVRIGAFDRAPITVDNPGLSGHTAITMDRSNTGTNASSGGAGYKQQAAIGASGTVNFTLTGAEQYRTMTIAITPGAITGTVSGGAGYVRQPTAGSSGTSTFTLGSSNEARTLTIAIAPGDPNRSACCQNQIFP